MDLSIIITIFFLLLIVVYCAFYFVIKPWLKAIACGLKITLTSVIKMRLAAINPYLIINNAIKLKIAEIPIDFTVLESHHIAGGHISKLTDALVKAKYKGLKIDYKQLFDMDLACKDLNFVLKDYEENQER